MLGHCGGPQPLEVWWSIHYGKKWHAPLQAVLEWLHHQTKGLDTAQGASWRREHWPEIIADAKAWKGNIKKATQRSIATIAATEHLHRWHFEFVERASDLGLQLEQHGLLQKGLHQDAHHPQPLHAHDCILCQETYATLAAWAAHANRKHGRIALERLLLEGQGTACLVCKKEYHTSSRLLRHLKYSQTCADLLHGRDQMQQAVRPGIGNTHLDRDRPLPVPVCPAEYLDQHHWTTVGPKMVRMDYSREFYLALLADFDAYVAAGALDEEGF